ncbi:MAG: lipid A export permease/ATP-binding protein MsbA, partial [Gammaproteobacteria bacterium]|nr:lipid A export permease/ATP-binding protein MsbA [Gammaproteobacteria bacterium]
MTTAGSPLIVSTYRRLLNYALMHWRAFLLAILGMILVALAQPAFAGLMKPMLDGSFVERDPQTIKWVPVVLLLVFLVRAFAGFLSEYYMALVGRHVIVALREEMFQKLLQLPTHYYDKNSTGNTIAKFTYNVEQVTQAATGAVTVLIRDALMVISLVGWMLYLSPMLASLFLLIGPIIALLVGSVSKRFRKISQRIQQSMGKVTHVVEESIQAQRVVKIFGGQDYESTRFRDINKTNLRQQMKLAATTAVSTPIIQIFVAFALAGIIHMATMPSMQDTITVGTFMSFMAAMMMMFAPIKNLTGVNAVIQRGIAAAESIFELLDTDVEKDTGTFKTSRVRGDIVFKDVTFRYQNAEKNVLTSISLHIKPGQTIALVGKSGSGKSTLVNLLPRLYDDYNGQVLIDGHDICDFELLDLRDQIAYVGPEIVLFNDTVAHNIAYRRLKDVTEEQIIAAAKAAHAWEFIEREPEGLQTMVGERGVKLSGGQRQRIAIARALLKDAPILIMDEATSALDTESERHIQSALVTLLKNRTTLVIAHRLSTIENADLILVMEDGRIVESGTHQDLLQLNGAYANFYRLQFSENKHE